MITVKITGQITDIFPSEIYGSFEKRVAWVQDQEDNKQIYQIEFWQGDANTLDKFKPGDTVTATCELRGKKWDKNGRQGVIVALRCTWILRGEIEPQEADNPAENDQEETSNDLPF